MKTIIIIFCLFFVCCKHTHTVLYTNTNCFSNNDLIIKNDIFILKPNELAPKFIEPIVVNENKCIGLYIIKYASTKKDIDLVQVPTLKIENQVLFSEWQNEDVNKANIEIFKNKCKDVFSSDELDKIERRFMVGIRITTHI